jgi:hypothetical protein
MIMNQVNVTFGLSQGLLMRRWTKIGKLLCSISNEMLSLLTLVSWEEKVEVEYKINNND